MVSHITNYFYLFYYKNKYIKNLINKDKSIVPDLIKNNEYLILDKKDSNMTFNMGFFNYPILFLAITEKNLNIEIVKLLIEKGANVNIERKDYMMPSHPLSMAGYMHDSIELLELLINNGADVYKKDSENRSVLHWTCYSNNIKVVKYLLDYGMDVNDCTNKQNSPLHFAEYASKELIEILIKNGANVNKQDSYGRTPLHCFKYTGNKEGIKLLLENGADINIVDSNNETYLQKKSKYAK